MIGRGRMQLAAPPEIAAAVADPAEPRPLLAHQAADEGGPHAPLAAGRTGGRFGGLADALVGPLRSDLQEVRAFVLAAVVAEGPGGVGIVGDLEEPLDGVDADARGDFAGLVPSHAVADDGDAMLRQKQKRVLVVVALAADIGGAGELEGHGRRSIADPKGRPPHAFVRRPALLHRTAILRFFSKPTEEARVGKHTRTPRGHRRREAALDRKSPMTERLRAKA